MPTEDLIQRLASDLQPVRRLQPVAIRVAGWFVAPLASLGLVMVRDGSAPRVGRRGRSH